MEIEIYSSPLIVPALASCIGASMYLYRKKKSQGALLMLLGFVIVAATNFSINYCIGLVVLDIALLEYPTICNSVAPYIKGVGYLLIAFGVSKIAKNQTNA
jgi:hypothetical protein